MGTAWLRIKALIHRPRRERELDDDCLELWTFAALATLWRDLRYAARTLAKSPSFTAVAVLSLALGIGANTAIFSLMDVMLLRALPVRNPQELVEFVRLHPRGSMMQNLPYPVFEHFQQNPGPLAGVFAIAPWQPAFRTGAGSERASAHLVSGSFFPALGVKALLGRTLGPEDTARVAVLSHTFWSRRFGRDPLIVGTTVRVSGEPFTIAGVMPPDFFGVDRSRLPDLWIPLPQPNTRELWVFGRLKPGVSLAQARAELEPVFQRALESLADQFQLTPERERVEFMSQRLAVNRAANGASSLRWSYWDYSASLKILVALAGLVLLIACANMANLLMARSAARSREIGIRLAIGASRWRVLRQLLAESLVLSLLGGAIGMAIAAWGHRLLLAFLLRDPRMAALDFRLDQRVLAFGFALSLVTGLAFGLLPALRATRADPAAAMHGETRQPGPHRIPLARTLLAVQVGMSMVLLAGAGLFARSLRNLAAADLGLTRDNLVLVEIHPSPLKTAGERQRFWEQLIGQVSGTAGVESASLAGDAVFGSGGWSQAVWVQQPARHAQIPFNTVGPGFFATVGIPLLRGREFGEQDRENAPLVAVVNQAFARRFFGAENPLGKRFGDRGQASSGRYEIIGVVADAKYGTVREVPRPMAYYPLLQQPLRGSLVLHLRMAPALLASLRRDILAMDDEALIGEARTLPDVVRGQVRQDRMFAALASFFALLALALGAIGIYGAVAYRVARRTAEIGLRMALGAQPGHVLWLVMREYVVLLAVGIAIGLPAAVWATRLVKSVLFGLEPWDPLTIAGATATLAAAGILAAFLPARRAIAIGPMPALRNE